MMPMLSDFGATSALEHLSIKAYDFLFSLYSEVVFFARTEYRMIVSHT